MRAFVLRVVSISLCFGLPACGGHATPFSSGPIIIETSLGSNLTHPTSPLAPGQSVTASFFEVRCRYQEITSEPAHGQLTELGCDAPFNPARVVVTIAPILATQQPCGLTAQVSGYTVVFTKTGQGDPGLGGPPIYFCSARIADPAVHEVTGGFTFLDL